MRRRELLGSAVAAAALAPFGAAAQQTRMPVIGYLSSTLAIFDPLIGWIRPIIR
jgi:hypothetical protein